MEASFGIQAEGMQVHSWRSQWTGTKSDLGPKAAVRALELQDLAVSAHK